MTTPGDPSATGPDRPCGITALLPIGMSCRGRAEAFARSLQSRLRNLGSQGGDDEEDDGLTASEEQQQQQQQLSENTWLSGHADEQAVVTSLQPLRMVANEADSFFDFGLEVESPNSPVEECEYTRLIETATATPTGVPCTSAGAIDPAAQAPESGYVCSSPCSTPHGSAASSNSSSTDCQFYDPDSSDPEQRSVGGGEFYDCPIVPPVAQCPSIPYLRSVGVGRRQEPSEAQTVADSAGRLEEPASREKRSEGFVPVAATSSNNPFSTAATSHGTANGHIPGYTAAAAAAAAAAASVVDSDSCSESLPPSQSTESNHSTFTGMSSNSNSTLQDVTMEPLEEEEQTVRATAVDVPDGAFHGPQRMGNGHAIMPIINPDTEIELISHPYGLKYDEDDEQHGGDGERTRPPCAVIQLEEVEKILKDCTTTEREPECEGVRGHDRSYRSFRGDSVGEDEDGRKNDRKSAMSSGDEDEEESKPQRIRRCSSLKTGKTPPGTPGRKKIVRFADVLGLDLTDVRTFMDEVPKVPQSAFEDLTILQATEPPVPELSLGPKADRVLVPLFQQPGALPCFLDRVREKQVNLENAAVTDPITLTITGTVRVRNLDFHKSVYVRYTLDNWRSYADLQAVYAENSCDGFSDKFSFTLHGNSVQVGQRIEMAVRFHCRGEQFWDNNYDTNYVFQCLPITQPTPMISSRPVAVPSTSPHVPEASWCSSFY